MQESQKEQPKSLHERILIIDETTGIARITKICLVPAFLIKWARDFYTTQRESRQDTLKEHYQQSWQRYWRESLMEKFEYDAGW